MRLTCDEIVQHSSAVADFCPQLDPSATARLSNTFPAAAKHQYPLLTIELGTTAWRNITDRWLVD